MARLAEFGYLPNGFSKFFSRRDIREISPQNNTAPLVRTTDGLSALRNLRTDARNKAYINPQTSYSEQGLETYFRVDHNSLPPVYIFDQHGLGAMYALAESVFENNIVAPAQLVNIDTHMDGRHTDYLTQNEITRVKSHGRLDNVTQGVLALSLSTKTEIDQFIANLQAVGIVGSPWPNEPSALWLDPAAWSNPALDQEIMSPQASPTNVITAVGPVPYQAANVYVQRVGWDAASFSDLRKGNIPRERFALSIDMDYFEQITDPMEIEREMIKMRDLITKAGVVVIATSPGYWPSDTTHQRAISLTRQLLTPLFSTP